MPTNSSNEPIYVGFDLNRQGQQHTQNAELQFLWKPFSPALVAEVQSQGKSVFIDFTAAWCITCQVNKKVVLRTEAIQKLFQDNDVVLFEADWTRQDPVITEALAKLGRNSVPVYVYYASGSEEAKILPQILTPSDIEGLFK